MGNKITNKNIIILAGGIGSKAYPYNMHGKISNEICGENLLEIAIRNVSSVSENITIIYDDSNMAAIPKEIDKNIEMFKTNKSSANEALIDFFEYKGDFKGDFIVYYASWYINSKEFLEMVKKSETRDTVSLFYYKSDDDEQNTNGISINVNDKKIEKIFYNPRAHYVNAKLIGLYFFNNKMIQRIKLNSSKFSNLCMGVPPKDEIIIENAISSYMENNEVKSFEVKHSNVHELKYPWDINLIFQKLLVEKLNGKRNYISKTAKIEKPELIPDNCYIDDGALVEGNTFLKENVYIGKNAKITDGAICRNNTHIGSGTKVGFHADVEGFIMEQVTMVHYCEIFGMIGRGADIAAGTFIGSLRFNDSTPLIKVKKITFQGKHFPVYIGNYTRTGVGTLFIPGSILGNVSVASPGAIISGVIPDNSFVKVIQKNTIEIFEGTWNPELYGD